LEDAEQPSGEVAAGVDGLASAVRRPGTPPSHLDRRLRVRGKGEGDRRQAHEGTSRLGIGGSRVWLPGLLEPLQGGSSRVPDVEAAAGAGEVSLPVPSAIAPQLIYRIETPTLDQALGQAQGH
jgi:hypothetical protein